MTDELLDLDAEGPDGPLCEFKLDGRIWRVRQATDVPLHAFADAQQATDDPSKYRVKLTPFFAAVIWPEDREDFLAMMKREDSPLTSGRARKLVEYINERVADRPTERSGGSSVGASTTDRASEAASSSPDTTPEMLSA